MSKKAVDVLSVDEQRNVFVDCNGKTEGIGEEVLESFIGGFEFACKARSTLWRAKRHVK